MGWQFIASLQRKLAALLLVVRVVWAAAYSSVFPVVAALFLSCSTLHL